MTQTGILPINPEDLNALNDVSHPAGAPLTFPISFATPFPAPPHIHLGLCAFNGGGEPYTFRFAPTNITPIGFEIHFHARRSWITSLQISWLATDA